MPTRIRATTGQRKLDYTPSPKEALKIASDLKVQLRRADGTVKSGTLKLMHTTHESKAMKFERKGWWQVMARRESKTKPTLDYFVKVLTQAYQPKDPLRWRSGDDTRQLLRTKLDELAKFGQDNTRITSAQALQYINELDAIAHQEYVSRFASGDVSTVTDAWTSASHALPGLAKGQPLGHGNYGAVYSSPDGTQVFKELTGKGVRRLETGATVDLKALDRWQPGAALLKEGCRVVLTQTFVIKNESSGQFYNVPAADLKAFLRHHPASGPDAPQLKLVGEIMPMVAGETLERRLGPDGNYPHPYSHSDQATVMEEGLHTLSWMAEQRFLHNDIKPDNLKFDRHAAAGQPKLRFLDNGSVQRLHNLAKKEEFAPEPRQFQATDHTGAERWAHPKVAANLPHGPESDLWSFMLTGLSHRFPFTGEAMKLGLNAKIAELQRQNQPVTPSVVAKDLLEDLVKDASGRAASARAKELEASRKAWDQPDTPEGAFLDLIKQGLDLAYNSTTETEQGYQDYRQGLDNLMQCAYLLNRADFND